MSKLAVVGDLEGVHQGSSGHESPSVFPGGVDDEDLDVARAAWRAIVGFFSADGVLNREDK